MNLGDRKIIFDPDRRQTLRSTRSIHQPWSCSSPLFLGIPTEILALNQFGVRSIIRASDKLIHVIGMGFDDAKIAHGCPILRLHDPDHIVLLERELDEAEFLVSQKKKNNVSERGDFLHPQTPTSAVLSYSSTCPFRSFARISSSSFCISKSSFRQAKIPRIPSQPGKLTG